MSEEKPQPSESDASAEPQPSESIASAPTRAAGSPVVDNISSGETLRGSASAEWNDEVTLHGSSEAVTQPGSGAPSFPSAAPVSSPSRQSAGAKVDGDLPDAPVTPEQAERYGFERDQGAGGQGVVTVVRDAVIGREVALKKLRRDRGGSNDASGATARFLREARITGQLEHPSIVPVYELGRRADGSLYYTQKLVRGRTLRAALSECHTLSERLRFLPQFVNICQAIAYAHGRGVVHRDLKPENVMVGEFGETVVLDWGLAKVLGSDKPKPGSESTPIPSDSISSRLAAAKSDSRRANLFFSDVPDVASAETRAGELFGTPQYMSPEQAMGHHDQIDQLSDVWTLGAMLFELLCGHAPMVRPGQSISLATVAAGVVPRVATLEPAAPPELAAVAERALERERSRRYQSAAELAHEISAYLIGDRVSVYEYSPWELIKKLAAKNPIPFACAVAALLVLVTSTILIERSHRSAVSALSETLAIQAASAELEERWDLAAALYAAARAQEERADARLGEAFAESLAPRPTLHLSLHKAPALATAFVGGSRLAGSSFDGELFLWDAQSGAQLAEVNAHQGPIWTLASSSTGALASGSTGTLAPGSTLLISGGADGRVRFWSADLVALGELPAAPSNVGAPQGATSADAILAAKKSRPAERTSDEGGEGAATTGIAALALSPDGKLLATSSLESGVDLWDAPARRWLLHLSGQASVFALGFSPDSKRLAVGTAEGEVRVFSVTGEELFREIAHAGRARAVAFSADGETIASGGQDDRIVLWRPGVDEAPRRLDGHLRSVTGLRFSPDGSMLASSSRDGVWVLWDVATGRPLSRIDADERAGNGLAFSPDGRSLAAAYQDQVVRVWEMPRERHIVGLAGHTDVVRAVAFAPSGAQLASVSVDGTARLWDRNGRALLTISAGEKLRAVAYAPQVHTLGGTKAPDPLEMLAIAGDGDSLALWDPATGKLRARLVGNPAGIGALAFAPHQSLLVSGGRDGALKIWDAKSGLLVKEVKTSHPAVESLAFHPRLPLLASAGNDGRVRIWSWPDLALQKELHAHSEASRGIAFSPDGALLASGGSDRRLAIYQTRDWTLLRDLRGHKGRVQAVAFSPDGRWLASSCSDHAVRIFSVASGELLWSSVRHQGAVMDLAWSPDGNTLATASADDTLELLRFDGIAELPPPGDALASVLRNYWLHFVGQRIEPLPPEQRGRSH